uniref:TGF-beta family profile domain-containing protein n=1 Tax=Pelusios castaneus TaxID=367368 RepID=A0A8C8SGS3_9SAUR
MSVRLGWIVCVLCLASTARGFSQKELKEALLQKLGLSEVPKLQKRDLVNLVIPDHIRNKYISMLKRHRVKRRALPMFKRFASFLFPMKTDIAGEVLYSDATRQNLVFDMEGRIPENSEVTMAELKLFKKPLDRRNMPTKQSHRPVTNARVSVYWVQIQADGTNRSSLIDSRLVPIMESGWRNFDVTQAVHYWLKAKKPGPMLLEIWIEGERLGSYPAGYQAYLCMGGCVRANSLLRHFGYGERTCAVAESSPLPMMYLVKKGNYTEIEVAEFPNMIVEKCGCCGAPPCPSRMQQ